MAFRHKEDVGKGFYPQPKQEKVLKAAKGINKVSPKKQAQKEIEKEEYKRKEEFYKKWFDEHPTHKCYETGQPIFYFSMKNIHHVVEKKYQDKYSIDIVTNPDNLVLLSLEVHSKAHTNMDFCPKVKELTEQAYKKFDKYLI